MNRFLKVTEPLFLLLVPAVLLICAFCQIEQTALLSILAAAVAVVPFFLRFENKKPRPRDIMPIVVLAAIASVGRIIFAPLPNFKPVSAIVIVSGVCFGKEGGFLTGALAAIGSNMFFGQGPWTPWQMYAWGLLGYLAGVLNDKGFFEKKPVIYIFAFLSAFLYGFIMDSWYIVGFISPITWQSALSGYGAGVPFNFSHAVSNVIFLLPIYKPWCKKIRRIQTKYGI